MKPLYTCEPAHSLITRCGGVARVARWLEVDRTRVLRWKHPVENGGTGGRVPYKHLAKLMVSARANGVDLSLRDLAPELLA